MTGTQKAEQKRAKKKEIGNVYKKGPLSRRKNTTK